MIVFVAVLIHLVCGVMGVGEEVLGWGEEMFEEDSAGYRYRYYAREFI